jgi:hypothetical protein
MKNARLRQTRQSDSREGSAFHHDLARDADGLVVSRSQSRAQYERWKSHHSSADLAQTGIGGGDERNSGSPANELRSNGEGTLGLSGVSAGVGANCESRQKMTTFVMSVVETSLIIFSGKVRDSSVRAGLAFSLGMTKSAGEEKICRELCDTK